MNMRSWQIAPSFGVLGAIIVLFQNCGPSFQAAELPSLDSDQSTQATAFQQSVPDEGGLDGRALQETGRINREGIVSPVASDSELAPLADALSTAVDRTSRPSVAPASAELAMCNAWVNGLDSSVSWNGDLTGMFYYFGEPFSRVKGAVQFFNGPTLPVEGLELSTKNSLGIRQKINIKKLFWAIREHTSSYDGGKVSVMVHPYLVSCEHKAGFLYHFSPNQLGTSISSLLSGYVSIGSVGILDLHGAVTTMARGSLVQSKPVFEYKYGGFSLAGASPLGSIRPTVVRQESIKSLNFLEANSSLLGSYLYLSTRDVIDFEGLSQIVSYTKTFGLNLENTGRSDVQVRRLKEAVAFVKPIFGAHFESYRKGEDLFGLGMGPLEGDPKDHFVSSLLRYMQLDENRAVATFTPFSVAVENLKKELIRVASEYAYQASGTCYVPHRPIGNTRLSADDTKPLGRMNFEWDMIIVACGWPISGASVKIPEYLYSQYGGKSFQSGEYADYRDVGGTVNELGHSSPRKVKVQCFHGYWIVEKESAVCSALPPP